MIGEIAVRSNLLVPATGHERRATELLHSNFVLTISSLLAIELITILYGRKD
jgi:hypothetical protein